MTFCSKHLASMEEKGNNLQRNVTDAEVSIPGLLEYELGQVYYQLEYYPKLWTYVLLAVGPVTFHFRTILCLNPMKNIEINP